MKFSLVLSILTLYLYCSTYSCSTALGEASQPTDWTIDGQKRQALIIPPSKTSVSPAPVIFVFHGHGGSMHIMERRGFQKLWPEAIVVCPQGLPTASMYDPQGKFPGWQQTIGGNGDRDVKFVDAILKTLHEKYKADDSRIFATGHSNGASFTYLLWGARGKQLAALAPVAGGAFAIRTARDLKPLPIIHISGENDPIVRFDNQMRIMGEIRRRNGCNAEGKPWAKSGDLVGTIYSSDKGAPFVAVIHPGDHAYPEAAPALIVRFFKESTKPSGP
ncbi:MAG: hypothetical protein U0903_02325 [Planctomycetales bacterium]